MTRLMAVTADGYPTNSVDLYNVTSGTWSTAQLSMARAFLSATSVGKVAIFAGGWLDRTSNSSFSLCFEGLLMGLLCAGDV